MVDSHEEADNPQGKQQQPKEERDKRNSYESADVQELSKSMFHFITTFFTVLFAGLLVISSFLTLGAIWAQVWIYNQQLKEMRKSTDAATKAAKAAENSVTLARENAHLDQRAWVADAEVASRPKENEPWIIEIAIRNTGKTFAKHVVLHLNTATKQSSDPDPDFDKILEESGSHGVPFILAPNGFTKTTLDMLNGKKLERQDLDELKNPTVIYFVFGKITYDDVFGCKHWTIYCFKVLPSGTLMSYGPYNDADDNCSP